MVQTNIGHDSIKPCMEAAIEPEGMDVAVDPQKRFLVNVPRVLWGAEQVHRHPQHTLIVSAHQPLKRVLVAALHRPNQGGFIQFCRSPCVCRAGRIVEHYLRVYRDPLPPTEDRRGNYKFVTPVAEARTRMLTRPHRTAKPKRWFGLEGPGMLDRRPAALPTTGRSPPDPIIESLLIVKAPLGICVLIVMATAGRADDAPSPIATDRPAVADSSVVVPLGSLQFENGLADTVSQGQRTFDISETLLRLGVAPKTELRLTTPDYFTQSGASSAFGDTVIGLRQQL